MPSGYEPRGPREEGVLACVHQPGTPSRGFDKRGCPGPIGSLDKGEGRSLSRGESLERKKNHIKKSGDREGTRARLFHVGVRPIVRYRTRAVHGERDNE